MIPRSLVGEFLRFLIVGGISFCIDYGLFSLLFLVGVPHLLASATSFTVSLVVNYILTRQYVFSASSSVQIWREFVAYAALNIIALGLNTLILYICADHLNMSPFLGKLVATAIVLIYNFISRKLLLQRMAQ